MNCEEIEPLMADAWGDELSPQDLPAFEAHLASCQRCRGEYETGRAAVERMRALPSPRKVTLRREGNRLVIGPPPPRRAGLSFWLSGAAFRYAASVLIAFAAGYTLHAGLMFVESSSETAERTASIEAAHAGPGSVSLQDALLRVHQRNPGYADLAKCIIALHQGKR